MTMVLSMSGCSGFSSTQDSWGTSTDGTISAADRRLCCHSEPRAWVEGAGSGLQGLRDRVEAIGGSFELESPRGRGTHVSATIPAMASRPGFSG